MVAHAESLEREQALAQLFEHLDCVLWLEAHVSFVGLEVALHQLLGDHRVVGVLQRAEDADHAVALLHLAAGPESASEQLERFGIEVFMQHFESCWLLILHALVYQAP